MNQRKKSEQTKEKLKTAALQLFAEKNVDEVSISDITAHAGYAVGTFYKHWKRKEDLTFELWHDITTTYMFETAQHNQSKTAADLSEFLVARVLDYAKIPFVTTYFTSQYYNDYHNEPVMTAAFDAYVQSIQQQLQHIHPEKKMEDLAVSAIAIADLLNGHVLNSNNFGHHSNAVLTKKQLICMTLRLVN